MSLFGAIMLMLLCLNTMLFITLYIYSETIYTFMQSNGFAFCAIAYVAIVAGYLIGSKLADEYYGE